MSIAKMSLVEVLVPRAQADELLCMVQDLGSVQLEEVPLVVPGVRSYLHRDQLSDGQLAEQRKLKDIARMLADILPLLKGSPYPKQEAIDAFRAELPSHDAELMLLRISRMKRRADSLWRKRVNINQDIETLGQYRDKLDQLSKFEDEIDFTESMKHMALLIDHDDLGVLETISGRLLRDTHGNFKILHSMDHEGDTHEADIALLAYPEEYTEQVRRTVNKFSLNEFHLPRSARGLPLMEAVNRLREQLKSLPGRLDEVEEQIAKFRTENYPAVLVFDHLSTDRLAQLEHLSNMAHSEMLSILQGWLPSEKLSELENALNTSFDKQLLLRTIEGNARPPQVPVSLDNHKIFKPFEHLLKLFSDPMYGSFDPTPIMAVVFPLFFGLILGDAAYGLGIIGLGLWARRKWRHMDIVRDITTIAMWCGASSVVFGIVYGEFLGDLPHRLHVVPVEIGNIRVMPIWNERKYIIDKLLNLTIIIGLAHIAIGLVLGIVEGLRSKHKAHGYERLGLLIGLMGIALFAVPAIPFKGLIAGLMILSGAVMLVIFSGPVGPIELISLFANVLSYSRIMALGVAGMVIADLANELAAEQQHFLLGILIAVPIHILALVLGILEPTIHALRLHYVEFLPKFFTGDGRPYQPLSRKGSNS